jgi:subtilisin family serine protease
MNFKSSPTIGIVCFFAFSGAYAQQPAKLVVTYEQAAHSNVMSAMNLQPMMDTIDVPAGQDPEVVAEIIRRYPGVASVERSFFIPPRNEIQQPYQISASSATYRSISASTNDPERGRQYYWDPESSTYAGVSDIQHAYDSDRQGRKVNIAVLDSGFENNADMVWAGGYNLSSMDLPVGPEYLDFDASTCPAYHGQAVGAIIGATSGNGIGMAGIVDADMYAIRVMGCENSGFLHEAAQGILYAAGDPGVTGQSIGVDIDVINLSLGAETGTCPQYMQAAVDFAMSRGKSVVVAAGNEADYVEKYSPANCEGVITVGALDRAGRKSSFSNFGTGIDVSALGSEVLTQGSFSPNTLWFGTSFSAPIVAGIAGLLHSQSIELPPAKISQLIVDTALPSSGTVSGMGSGVVNARAALQAYDQYVSSLPSINALDFGGSRCSSDDFASRFPGVVEPCGLNEFDAGQQRKSVDEFFVILEGPRGADLTLNNATVKTATRESVFLLRDVKPDLFGYGLMICANPNGTSCSSQSAISIDTSRARDGSSCNR